MSPQEDGEGNPGAALPSSDLEEPLLGNAESSTPADPSAGGASPPINKDISLHCCNRDNAYKVNHNVFLNLVLCVTYGMSDSLWTGTVTVAYLKRLGHDANSVVGNIEAVNGMAVLLSALPVGYLADTYGRSRIIRAGGILMMLTAVVHGFLLEWIGTDETALTQKQRETSLFLIAIVMGLWGVGGGIVSGPAQALYADSTPAGDRSTYYHYLFVTYLVASCLGPALAIILFQKLGDNWNLYQLRSIMYVGLGMEAFNSILMMFFDDRKALEEDEETPPRSGASANESSKTSNGTSVESTEITEPTTSTDGGLDEPLLRNSDTDVEGETGDAATEEVDAVATIAAEGRRWMIPYILFFSGLVFSIGSGMTVIFFPLFFKDEVKMSPSQVQFIYLLVPIVMSVFSGVGTRAAKFMGRVETTMALQGAGIACLYAMVVFRSYLDTHPFILVPLYVVRTGLMNAPYPLCESILMDFVPKRERARWKSLESISQFGWCGSAAAGGYISDRWDYSHTFFITATIQLSGMLMFALLLPLVPRSEDSLAVPNNDNNQSRSDSDNNVGGDETQFFEATEEPTGE